MKKEPEIKNHPNIVRLAEALLKIFTVVEVRHEALRQMTVAELVQLEEEVELVRKGKRNK